MSTIESNIWMISSISFSDFITNRSSSINLSILFFNVPKKIMLTTKQLDNL